MGRALRIKLFIPKFALQCFRAIYTNYTGKLSNVLMQKHYLQSQRMIQKVTAQQTFINRDEGLSYCSLLQRQLSAPYYAKRKPRNSASTVYAGQETAALLMGTASKSWGTNDIYTSLYSKFTNLICQEFWTYKTGATTHTQRYKVL